jgi:hypothetical protein
MSSLMLGIYKSSWISWVLVYQFHRLSLLLFYFILFKSFSCWFVLPHSMLSMHVAWMDELGFGMDKVSSDVLEQESEYILK